MEECRKWKWIAENELELSNGVPNQSIPNTSGVQDTSIVYKMKTYTEERPDFDEYYENNRKFLALALQQSKKMTEISERLNTFCENRNKLIQEISDDVRDDILLSC